MYKISDKKLHDLLSTAFYVGGVIGLTMPDNRDERGLFIDKEFNRLLDLVKEKGFDLDQFKKSTAEANEK